MALRKMWSTTLPEFVTTLKVSSEGNRIVALTADQQLAQIVRENGAVELASEVCAAAPFSGQAVVSLSNKGILRLAELEVALPCGKERSVTFSDVHFAAREGALLVARGKELFVINVAEGGEFSGKLSFPSSITSLVQGFHPVSAKDATIPILASSFGGIQAFAPTTLAVLKEWISPLMIVALAPSPRTAICALGLQNGKVVIWDYVKNENLKMSGYQGKVSALCWDPQGRYLVTGCGEQLVIWDFSGKGPRGQPPLQVDGHEGEVTAISYNEKGTIVASGDDQGTIILSRGGSFAPLTKEAGLAPVTQLLWVNQTKQLVSGHASGEVVLWGLG